jgi:hypothetical protein
MILDVAGMEKPGHPPSLLFKGGGVFDHFGRAGRAGSEAGLPPAGFLKATGYQLE